MAEMIYRRLGCTGMKISAISLGAWLTYGSDSVEAETARECMRVAIENGINFIDVANVYARGEAEKTVGQVIKDFNRDNLVISTKAFGSMSDDVNDRGLSRKHLVQSVDASLKRLGLDYIDIFFCHRYDPDTPTEETVRAIDDLIAQGKILYWGTSMWEGHQLQEAVDAADKYLAYRPVVDQSLYNMLDRQHIEGALESKLDEHAIGEVVYSPLAGGLLTGKYNDSVPEGSRLDVHGGEGSWINDRFDEHRLEKGRKITALAQEYGYEPAALALAWAMDHPNVDSVITGASKPRHVESNLKALDVVMTAELEAKIETILMNKPFGSTRSVVTPDEDAFPAL